MQAQGQSDALTPSFCTLHTCKDPVRGGAGVGREAAAMEGATSGHWSMSRAAVRRGRCSASATTEVAVAFEAFSALRARRLAPAGPPFASRRLPRLANRGQDEQPKGGGVRHVPEQRPGERAHRHRLPDADDRGDGQEDERRQLVGDDGERRGLLRRRTGDMQLLVLVEDRIDQRPPSIGNNTVPASGFPSGRWCTAPRRPACRRSRHNTATRCRS